MAGVLAFMYFGYLPGKRGASTNLQPFVRTEENCILIHNADDPRDLIGELHRIQDALSNLRSTLAFHRLDDEQRYQYHRAFAELEVLIQQIAFPTKAGRIAS